MSQGHFYNDPPPQQPRRFVPIPAQGDQPPRRTAALMMGLVLSSWPTGYEHQPWQQPLKVAPLTLTYGDQPPVTSGQRDIDVFYSTMAVAWEPAPPQPYQRPRTVAPLTLVYGNQPPPYSTVNLSGVIQSWPTGLEHPAWQRPRNLAPLTITYGDQPPRLNRPLPYTHWLSDTPVIQGKEFSAAIIPATVVAANPPFTRFSQAVLSSWIAEPQLPFLPKSIAPLTLNYGQQPPRRNPASVMPVVLASWPTGLEYQPYQRPLTFAPLTLTYGQQPPRLNRRDLAIIAQAWTVEQSPMQRATFAATFGASVPPSLIICPASNGFVQFSFISVAD